ncbi:MAG: 2-hydroxyacyl-CoA dehydratase family protein [Thermodesulfobacteriota bacterium]|nr:2-hydroxyacyl-CoA dehydratase family protein [Thermodesulfobacteriota bacterium]
MTGLEQRFQQVRDLVNDYAVDGVVYSVVKFCDQHLCDAAYFAEKLDAEGIPLLLLENEYSWRDIGQIRTRIEAFVEMLQEKERR